MSVAELLATHSSAELTEWMAYEQITGPIGGEREDILTAILAATVANTARGKRGRKAKVQDFLPKWDRHKRASWQDMLATVRQINSALGGTDKTGGGDGGGDAGRTAGRDRHGHRRSRRRRAGGG